MTGIKTCDATELSAWLQSEDPPLLLDVTPEDRFRAVRLPGARNACVYLVSFLDDVTKLASGTTGPIVVYGSSERTLASADAAEKLRRAGYENLTDFRGGLEAWVGARRAVEGEGEPPAAPPPPGREDLSVDVEKSLVRWVGRNLAGRHDGEIRIAGGSIVLSYGRLSKGTVTVDMRSITCSDIADSKLSQILVRHLEMDDFFDVELHPEATFDIETAEPIPDSPPGRPDTRCRGILTLKGVSRPVAFDATTGRTADGGWAAQASLDIDRTEWGVNFGSGRLHDFLGKHLVNDHVGLDLTLLAR